MEKYLQNFKNCLEKEEPYCQAKCPFRLDVKSFVEKIKRGAYRAAYQQYRDTVGFPAIVCQICTRPCETLCPRKDYGGAIQIQAMERSIVQLTEDQHPTVYNLPAKPQRVAVIGGGLSGLAVTLRLANKKYQITLYEKTSRLGGHLWESLPDADFTEEIQRQLAGLDYTLKLETEITNLEQVMPADVIYIATGKGGEAWGANHAGDLTIPEDGHPLILSGGRLHEDEDVNALADGLENAVLIDNYFRSKRIIPIKKSDGTKIQVDDCCWTDRPPALSEKTPWTEAALAQEANRCLLCQCDFCRTYCDLTAYVDKWPLRIQDEILATTLPGWSEVKATPAKRLMSTCNQCGVCKEVCPEDIDIGGLILEGRKSMHRQDKAPWVFHDFWIRDMNHANGPDSLVCISPPNKDHCQLLFFPGCQMGASRPDLVQMTYDYLLSKEPSTGLLLQCCGVPVEWAGMEEEHQEELTAIRTRWENMGKPRMVIACPTCGKKFQQHLPEIPFQFLYEWITDEEQSHALISSHKELPSWAYHSYGIFDACPARNFPSLSQSVRTLVERTIVPWEELPIHSKDARCCSFGGQPAIANPGYKDFVANRRISLSELPYITYCINCRDVFLEYGKNAVHILDLFFSTEDSEKVYYQPTVTERRQNREQLKKDITKKYWKKGMEEMGNMEDGVEKNEKPLLSIELLMSDALRKKVSKQRLLESDLVEVISYLEKSGRKMKHTNRNTYSGYKEVGYMTCWVEYEVNSEGQYVLHNAYSHRMKIELEDVWNGKKREDEHQG